MQPTEMFTQAGIDYLAQNLAERTKTGNITRSNFCQALGWSSGALPKYKKGEAPELTEKRSQNLAAESIVGNMINLGVVPGFVNHLGPNGGIGPVNPTTGTVARKGTKTNPVFPPGFVELALTKLHELIPVGDEKTRINRVQLTKAMGCPGSKEEASVSEAHKQGFLAPFYMVRGPFGGFGRSVPKGTVVQATEPETAETAPVSAPVSSTGEPWYNPDLVEEIQAAPESVETEVISESTPSTDALAPSTKQKKNKKNKN